MKNYYFGILTACVIASTTFGAVTFDDIRYKGYIDLTGLASYSNNYLMAISQLTATTNELFISLKETHALSSSEFPNVYCIGMPEVGDSVSEPVRTLGSTNHLAKTISVLSSQGNDVIIAKYTALYNGMSVAWTEDSSGGNLNTNVTGDAPGDDRYVYANGNWRDGRSATLESSSTGRDNGPPLVLGYFLKGGPVSWTNSFGDQINHGKMTPIHEMRGHFPFPASSCGGVIEHGKFAFFYTVPHEPENQKVYIEAGEVTWDDGEGKWMVPTNAEASFAPSDYVDGITNHGVSITILDEKIYALDLETALLHLFETAAIIDGTLFLFR